MFDFPLSYLYLAPPGDPYDEDDNHADHEGDQYSEPLHLITKH